MGNGVVLVWRALEQGTGGFLPRPGMLIVARVIAIDVFGRGGGLLVPCFVAAAPHMYF